MAMEAVTTPESPLPLGPYSQAIKANGFVFLCGQVPADPSGKLVEGTVAEKAHRMCQNTQAVLKAAGSSLDKVVKVIVYFRNADDLKDLNEVYAQFFPHKPARSAIETSMIPGGASFELDITALQ
ncbi:hypothetical protein NM208_g2843 [Fusarium decemcellulare]|uniref:Uncharacterized protein n=1 Tax=Fusarium decemcellulare TaxID=57161 RepID=A0ACC1SR11_9HYPO|nr:hypothetical protein NM208_g2843 [Fusarium decemcellulare]